MRYQNETDFNGETISSAYVAHDPVLSDPGGPSLTRQEFADECDINNLMAQYEQTGVINHFNNGTPQYVDLVGVPNLQDAIHLMRDAESAFMRLPAATRREFDNSPEQFVAFATDPKNVDKMREWGLAAPLPATMPLEPAAPVAEAPKTKKGTSTAPSEVPF